MSNINIVYVPVGDLRPADYNPRKISKESLAQLKDGTVAKYIYYGCGRTKDRQCKNYYLREEELTEQLVGLLDKIDLNKTGVQMKFEVELRRFNKFQRGVLGTTNPKAKHKDVDLRTYAKYILREGTNEEKRELMGCLKSRILLQDRKIRLQDDVAE